MSTLNLANEFVRAKWRARYKRRKETKAKANKTAQEQAAAMTAAAERRFAQFVLPRIEASSLGHAVAVPLPSRLRMLARELRVLQHTYDQLLAEYEQSLATAA